MNKNINSRLFKHFIFVFCLLGIFVEKDEDVCFLGNITQDWSTDLVSTYRLNFGYIWIVLEVYYDWFNDMATVIGA